MPSVIANFDADHPQPAFAKRPRLGPLDLDKNRGGLPRLKGPKLPNPQIPMPPRNVEQQIPDSPYPGFGGRFGSFRPNSLQRP
jgi:hypothetical protein